MLSHMRFERETSLFGSDPGLINGAAELFVRFSRRCSDLTVQIRDARRKRAGGGIVFRKEPPLLFALFFHLSTTSKPCAEFRLRLGKKDNSSG